MAFIFLNPFLDLILDIMVSAVENGPKNLVIIGTFQLINDHPSCIQRIRNLNIVFNFLSKIGANLISVEMTSGNVEVRHRECACTLLPCGLTIATKEDDYEE